MKHPIKNALCAAMLGLVTLSAAMPAHAEQCGGTSLASQLLQKHKEKLKALGCKDDTECADKREDLVKTLIDAWNALAGNGSLTIGPRRLDLDTKLTGTVINPGERRFVSLPIVGHDKVKLSLKKTGGKAETDVSIYTLDDKGNCVEVASQIVPAGDGSFSKSWNLTSVRGKVIIVHLKPKGLGRKLEYTLLADAK